MAANQFIKRAYAESEYTPELLVELQKCKRDPVYFIKSYVMLQHPKKGKMLFKLYDFQEELVHCIHTNKRVVSLISRQMGKCFSGCTTINTVKKPSVFKMAILYILDKKKYRSAKSLHNT